MLARSSGATVRVRTPSPSELASCLSGLGVQVEPLDDGVLLVTGASSAQVGDAAHPAGVALHGLTEVESSLEQAYMELTASSLEYVTATSPEGAR